MNGPPIRVMDYEELARARIDPAAWDYIQGGSGDELTLRANRAAFDRLQLRPNVLVDVSRCDTAATVLGASLRAPILVAPMAYHDLVHPDGELATVRAVGAAGSLLVVSTLATRRLEDVAQAARGPLWLQLYCFRRRELTASLIRRAEAAGYRALVLTVDTPRLGRRDRDSRNGFSLPPHLRAANFEAEVSAALNAPVVGESAVARHVEETFDPSLTWDVIGWIRRITKLPLLLKGVLTAEDAARAVDHGVEGILVSNHGGRQLDGAVAAIDALPEIVQAVQGRCEVLLDGGVRRGTDVLKALALGARAVLVGRPVLWALAAAGEEGVRHVLSLLQEELELSLALAGRPSLSRVDATLIRLPPSERLRL